MDEGGVSRGEAWPVPEGEARSGEPLPRVEELPLVERGYEPERVQEAFDAFYRHIGRLDATLRAIEAVEAFRSQAAELRKELRALRTAGWTQQQQPWPMSSTWRPVSSGLPDALPRVALEAAFLIAVAVVVAVAGFDSLVIVLAMALAWAIVGVVEWAASRERFGPAIAAPPAPALPSAEGSWAPAPASEDAPGAEPEELTGVAVAAGAEPVGAEPRRRFWRLRRDGAGAGWPDEARPRHVRVLPADRQPGGADQPPVDPWEQGFEVPPAVEEQPAEAGSGPAVADEPALAARASQDPDR